MICIYCRKDMPDDSRFCPQCGRPVSNREPETEAWMFDLLEGEYEEGFDAEAEYEEGFAQEYDEEEPERENPTPPRKKSGKAGVVAVAAVLLAAGAFGLFAGKTLARKSILPKMERNEVTATISTAAPTIEGTVPMKTEVATEPTVPPTTTPPTEEPTVPAATLPEKEPTQPATEPTEPEMKEITAKTAAKHTMLSLSGASFKSNSELVDGGVTYRAKNAFDGNNSTAWVEGEKDYGTGANIQIDFGTPTMINGIVIRNGYHKSRKLFNANARVKVLEMNIDGKVEKVLYLEDNMNPQEFVLKTPVEARKITFTIDEVYYGTHYKDTCISEIGFFYDTAVK